MSLGFVHDLNNVLGPIAAYADLADTAIDAGSPVVRYVEQIKRAAERGRALAFRLNELARGRHSEPTAVDMADLADEIVGWLRASRPDLTIEFSRDDVATTVQGDPVRLHQVVMNLAQNGVEALSDRAGTVTVHLDHTAVPANEPQERMLRLEVHDDGRGIEHQARARIFEPFFSTKHDGSGLGLNVSREIVRAHGGELHVAPRTPRGTTATVTLPLASSD